MPQEPAVLSRRPDVSVVTSAHDVGDGRLHRLCEAFIAAGLAVEVLAQGRYESAPDGVRYYALPPGGGLLSRLRRVATCLRAARGRAVVVLDPELAFAGQLLRCRGHLLVADVHEDYSAVVEDRVWAHGARKVAARLAARGSSAVAARADLTVVADEHVPPLRARERLVVRNRPRLRSAAVGAVRAEVPRVVYVGDVRRSRGFRTMVAGVLACPPWELDVVGPVHPEDRAWFEQESRVLGERVRLHGRLPPAQAWRVAAGAWAGLCLLEDTPAFREAVPTKIYEYLGEGLAVVVTPLPRVVNLVKEAGAGAVVTDAADLSSTLRRWLEEPQVVDLHRENARRWADRHAGDESPFDILASRLSALLGPR